jgi:hypothetical protein
LENSSVTLISSASLCDALSIATRYRSGVLDGYVTQFANAAICKAGVEYTSPVTKVNRAAVIFRADVVSQIMLPTWEITEATLTLFLQKSDGAGTTSFDGYLFPYDPRERLDDLAALFALMAPTTGQIVAALSTGSLVSTAIVIHETSTLDSAQNMVLLNTMMHKGFLAFCFKNTIETPLTTAIASGIATPLHATSADRPTLTLVHRDTIRDMFLMPDDLQHAALLQTVNDWQVRKIPGMRQETQRGVSISSGQSYLKDPTDLLPEVKLIAQHYARVL